MIFVISVRLLIHWNIHFYNALQMLNFIMKSYHGLINVSHNTLINLSPEQILMQKYVPGPINDNLRRRLDLLILFIKKYVYTCKVNVVPLNCTQFINNLKTQWKIERLT